MNQEIVSYIKEAVAHGLSELEIKKNLLDAGWEAQMVEASFAHFKAQSHSLPHNADEDIKMPATGAMSTNQSHAQNLPQTGAAQAPSLQTSISQERLNFQSLDPTPLFKRPVFYGATIAAVLILAGAAYAFYTFVYASPEKVWKKFTEAPKDKILSSDFKFTYTDNTPGENDDLGALPFKNLNLAFSGKIYADTTDEANPQSSTEASYTFSSGNSSVSMGFEYRLVGKKFYLNVGNNPLLSNIVASVPEGKQIDWVVLDLAELEKMGQSAQPANAEKLKSILSGEQVNELKKIWEDARFVKMDSYVGKEKLNGKTTLRFKNSLDKEAIKSTLYTLFDEVAKSFQVSDTTVKSEDLDLIKFAINELVDKITLKEFESWVGLTDGKLYRTKLVVSAPSVVSIFKALVLESSQANSRDAKRLNDVRQMASALELYFNDFGQYPQSKDGKPVGIETKYIGLLPTSPLPSDGNCTDYYNTYWYEAKDTGRSYEMTFCLGNSTGGYESGINKLTPMGINKLENCPSTPENCFKARTDEPAQETIKKAINTISFDGEISIDANYMDYGVIKEVKPPENAFDLIELFQKQVGGFEPQALPSQ